MHVRTHHLSLVLGMIALFTLSACGGIATPEWAAEVEETRIAQISTADYLTEIAPTATPIPATNTPTAIPATATETASPTPSPTVIPPTATTVPTVIPVTAEVAAPATGGDPLTVALAAGDPVAGQTAFNLPHTLPDETVWACSTCHSVTPDQLQLIGPGLWNVSVRGETRVEGQNALDYIHTSILAPQEFIVPPPEGSPGWAINMPAGWDEALGEQEFNDIVAYLFTLRDE